jgi:hypothetical protein
MNVTTRPEPGQPAQHEPRRNATDLDDRYGEIGISAVAAALPYAGAHKKATEAPDVVRIDQRFIELAV